MINNKANLFVSSSKFCRSKKKLHNRKMIDPPYDYRFIILIVFSYLSNLIESKNLSRDLNYVAFQKGNPIHLTTKKRIPEYDEQCGRDIAKKSQNETYFLICSKDKNHLEEISKLRNHGFYTNVTYSSHNFPLDCPCAYDSKGLCRQNPHICTLSNSNFYCNFKLSSVILSRKGGLIDCRTLSPISFSHSSMSMSPPIYDDSAYRKWQDYYIKNSIYWLLNIERQQKKKKKKLYLQSIKTYDLVVPTRMVWDSYFNHISFQSIPFIAHIKTFYNEIWYNITWHSSLKTAAILKLLDVKDDKIVIEKTIYAKNVIFPWVPGWFPIEVLFCMYAFEYMFIYVYIYIYTYI
jgi:hypothetical protein